MKQLNCVLLIDDDPITNYINSNLIKECNISKRVEVKSNGEEGINFIREFAEKNNADGPELIFLDLNMPVMDGFEFLRVYKNIHLDNKANTDAVVLTTSSHLKDTKLLQMEKIMHINKPLTENKLSEILHKNKIMMTA
ncbi:MAG: response regulator [Cytophagaceae bacterium]|nr:response regulator [Cytophagaceae bacterium]